MKTLLCTPNGYFYSNKLFYSPRNAFEDYVFRSKSGLDLEYYDWTYIGDDPNYISELLQLDISYIPQYDFEYIQFPLQLNFSF